MKHKELTFILPSYLKYFMANSAMEPWGSTPFGELLSCGGTSFLDSCGWMALEGLPSGLSLGALILKLFLLSSLRTRCMLW